MYNFTELAVQLNEPEPNVAPTDTRLRPDQRLMEEAKWDDANKEKLRLEEKQRVRRKQLEQAGSDTNGAPCSTITTMMIKKIKNQTHILTTTSRFGSKKKLIPTQINQYMYLKTNTGTAN